MVPRGDTNLRAAGEALTDPGRVYVIFNPASGRGRGRRRIAEYRAELEREIPHVEFGLTEHAGHEAELADRAIERGFGVVVAAGGDGTWSHVADRVVAANEPDVAFGMLPNGTGNDFGRSLGLAPGDTHAAVRNLVAGHRRRVDVGRLITPSFSEGLGGEARARHFLNLIGFGFDVAVIDAAAEARFLKGELLYKVTALQQLFRFPGVTVDVEAHPGGRWEGRHLMLTVSNGRYFGGGFPIAPGATVDDGELHACSISDASPLARLALFNQAERGRHVESPHVRILNGTRITVRLPEPPRFELDGDVFLSTDAEMTAEILPGRLQVVAPAPADPGSRPA